jgi:hypothetical protein
MLIYYFSYFYHLIYFFRLDMFHSFGTTLKAHFLIGKAIQIELEEPLLFFCEILHLISQQPFFYTILDIVLFDSSDDLSLPIYGEKKHSFCVSFIFVLTRFFLFSFPFSCFSSHL